MSSIRMYGTGWCPDCFRAKQVFKRYNIAYDWVNIDEDAEAVAYAEKVNGGYRSVPTIVFPDGSVLVEPSNQALEAKLASLK